MRQVVRWVGGLAVTAVLLAPQLAAAVPITYYFQSGTVTISASAGATTLLTVPAAPIDAGYLTFDESVPELTDLRLVVAGEGPYSLTTAYAGYDIVTLNLGVLTPAAGYSGPAALQLAGPPLDNYAFNGGPVKTMGFLTVSDSTFTNPTANIGFNIFQPSAAGTLFVNTVTGNIALIGVTIGVVPPSGGETDPLIIKGDFFFHGLVPEPGTALLVGAGLLGLVAAGRRARG